MKRNFRVSTKAAIFSADKGKVLVIHMDQANGWGLPGGHIEQDETLDEAMVRELYEECGITSNNLEHADFFMHSEGKLILAYVGTTDQLELKSPQDNLEGIPKWLTRDEFDSIEIEPNYRTLVINEWPKL